MRPSLGYSNISWVTEEKMRLRREAAKNVGKESLPDPEPICDPKINIEEKREDVVEKKEVSSEFEKQKMSEEGKVFARAEKKEPVKENKDTVLERDV